MREAMAESQRRRAIQEAFNTEHGIVPEGIKKRSGHALAQSAGAELEMAQAAEATATYGTDPQELEAAIARLERQMRQAAQDLAFEEAARLRDEAQSVRQMLIELG